MYARPRLRDAPIVHLQRLRGSLKHNPHCSLSTRPATRSRSVALRLPLRTVTGTSATAAPSFRTSTATRYPPPRPSLCQDRPWIDLPSPSDPAAPGRDTPSHQKTIAGPLPTSSPPPSRTRPRPPHAFGFTISECRNAAIVRRNVSSPTRSRSCQSTAADFNRSITSVLACVSAAPAASGCASRSGSPSAIASAFCWSCSIAAARLLFRSVHSRLISSGTPSSSHTPVLPGIVQVGMRHPAHELGRNRLRLCRSTQMRRKKSSILKGSARMFQQQQRSQLVSLRSSP